MKSFSKLIVCFATAVMVCTTPLLTLSAQAEVITDQITEEVSENITHGILLEEHNIEIASGNFVDRTGTAGAADIYQLTQGTIVLKFNLTGTGQYESLFSVSNSTVDGVDRHFHIYATPDGTVGMELRNTDNIFKYSMSVPNVESSEGYTTIAFRADPSKSTYTLFAHGGVVGTLTKDDFKFLNDITGLDRITLGGTVRASGNQYPFEGSIEDFVLYSDVLSDEELIDLTADQTQNQGQNELLLEESNIDIVSGQSYDLSNAANASRIENLEEGTVIIKFRDESTNGIQSLFSVGNNTSGNQNRHFHVYVTKTGLVGMELRNNDSDFKYTLNRPAALEGRYHGNYVENTVAFKADKNAGQYKLFANGVLLGESTVSSYKFIKDITGVNNITAGATIREGNVAYPFGGSLSNIKIYNYPLSDEELLEMTGETRYGTRIFHAEDGLESNYYRIPTLLKLTSGTVVSSIDTRYGGTHDARSNIDIGFSKSTDGGVTWTAPTLPLVFDDYAAEKVDWPRDSVGKNQQISNSAAFIDSVLLQDEATGRLFLFADAYPYGRGFNNSSAGTGFKEIAGEKYIKLHKDGDAANTYNYSIRDNGIIYNDTTNEPTQYTVDGDYRILENGNYLTQQQYHVYFNGTSLVEERTNTYVNQCIFYKDSLFHVLPTNYLAMKYSDDEGNTWSDMKLLGKFKDTTDRNVLYGPGIGTQIHNGPYAGRLLISSYNSVSGDYGYLYSDDHGQTWGFINTDLGGSGSFAEAQIIEFPDGSLRTYMRTNVGKIGYITSTDGGMTWSSTVYINGITVASYGTQLSVINYSQTVDGKPAIILSTPTSSSGRRAGKIYVGLINDTGGTGSDRYSVDWAYSYDVDLPDYGFSYSCLAELPDRRIGLLYEKYDSWSRDELHLKDIMQYEIFSISELTGNNT